MEEMRVFHTFYRILYGKLSIQKLRLLVYQLQLFNKKLISTSFKTRENAFTIKQKPAWHNVCFLKLYRR